MTKPALLLLPNLLHEDSLPSAVFPHSVNYAVETLDGLIAENEKEGRKYLKRFKIKKPLQEMPIVVLNEHTDKKDLMQFLEPIRRGERWGIISDAGLPCIADPGADLVALAHESGISVEVFVGPSSIILALMLSGFSGQHFSFHGYLDKDKEKRKIQILELERRSRNERSTQIFIETPYRNSPLLIELLNTLSNKTRLCIAWDLTGKEQGVISQEISKWKKNPLPLLDKKPALFLFAA